MEWTNTGTLGSSGGWLDGDQSARKVTAFNVNSDTWAYQNNSYYGDWSVWYVEVAFIFNTYSSGAINILYGYWFAYASGIQFCSEVKEEKFTK